MEEWTKKKQSEDTLKMEMLWKKKPKEIQLYLKWKR